MDQHPVPQNISSYEFRLVGDMTLKQFFWLAGGMLVALFFYKLPVPGLLKYPLMGVSAIAGGVFAFIPLNGRPFSQWLFAFFKATYSPTEYLWSAKAVQTQESSPVPEPTLPRAESSLDKLEAQLVAKFGQLFSQAQDVFRTRPTAAVIPSFEPEPESPAPTAPVPPPPPAPPSPPPPVIPQTVFTAPPELELVHSVPVADTPPAKITPMAAYSPVTAPAATSNATKIPTPTLANILAGLVVDDHDQLVETAILEIVASSTGIPVRALRTNKLGQFQIATPLPDGQYVVNTEKDGYKFASVSFTAEGKIIQPILIRGIKTL